jgi:hypothetical protein
MTVCDCCPKGSKSMRRIPVVFFEAKLRGCQGAAYDIERKGCFTESTPVLHEPVQHPPHQEHTPLHGSFLRRRTRAALCQKRTVSNPLRRENRVKGDVPAPLATSCRPFHQCPLYQNANTDGFSRGDFCRIPAMGG